MRWPTWSMLCNQSKECWCSVGPRSKGMAARLGYLRKSWRKECGDAQQRRRCASLWCVGWRRNENREGEGGGRQVVKRNERQSDGSCPWSTFVVPRRLQGHTHTCVQGPACLPHSAVRRCPGQRNEGLAEMIPGTWKIGLDR